MGMTRWTVNGSAANARDVAEQLALGRQAAKKRSAIEREDRERERDARAVGRALRKGARETGRGRFPIRCAPAPVAGRRKGSLRSRRFETLVGLGIPRPSKVGSDGLSSFHCKFTSRGLGNGGGRSYARGEAVKAVRYIMRDAAREIEEGGIVSNISADPDVIAGVFAALEELEHLGRGNANMYMSLVVALPHELKDRETLLADICAPFEQLGVPFAAVLHRPDKDGNQRNYHTHIMFSMRPFKRLDDESFAFADETLSWMNTGDYFVEFRTRTAEVLNDAMACEGHKRRFTPLSNAARGEAALTKREGKSTPGRKHHERRAEDIAFMKQERQLIAERIADGKELTAALRRIIGRPNVSERVAVIVAQEAVISRSLVSRSKSEGAPADAAPAAVWTTPSAPTQDQPLDGQPDPAVAHAQPAVPIETTPPKTTATPKNLMSDHALPPVGSQATPLGGIVKSEGDQSSAKVDNAPNGNRPGLPLPPPTRRSKGALLEAAREAARRRPMKTTAPVDAAPAPVVPSSAVQAENSAPEGRQNFSVTPAQPAVPTETPPPKTTATPEIPVPDFASPLEQPPAQPIAQIVRPERNSPGDGSNRDGSGTRLPAETRSTGALKAAREAARQRPITATAKSIAAGRGTDADDPWTRERATGQSGEKVPAPEPASPKMPKQNAPSTAPLTVEARIADIVKRFKNRRQYQSFPEGDRYYFDQYIDLPCRFVRDGLIALRIENGRLEMNIRDKDVQFVGRLVESVPDSLALLREIASELGPDMPVGPTLSWRHVIGDDDDFRISGLDRGGNQGR